MLLRCRITFVVMLCISFENLRVAAHDVQSRSLWQGPSHPTRQLQGSHAHLENLDLAQLNGKWTGLTFPLVEVGGLACLSEACRESIPTTVTLEISGDRLVYDGMLGDAVAASDQSCLTAGANERFEGKIKDFTGSRLYVDFNFQEVDLKTSDAKGDPILAAFDLSATDVEPSCIKIKVFVKDGVVAAVTRMENSFKGSVNGFVEKANKQSAIFKCFDQDVPPCNIDLEDPLDIALEAKNYLGEVSLPGTPGVTLLLPAVNRQVIVSNWQSDLVKTPPFLLLDNVKCC